MNEITFTGNVSNVHDPRRTCNDETIFSFDMAVENGYFDKNKGKWISRTRFQTVVTYRELAVNALNTISKGMAVTVTGRLLDDSYVQSGSDRLVRRDKLEATDVAVSLRFATAVVAKTGKTTEEQGHEHNRAQLAAVA